jgi:hypothetical protein
LEKNMTLANITNSAAVDHDRLPTIRTLIRSTIVATAVAGVLAVTCVLPAEYAYDPTGVGRVLGLTEMGEIKRDAEAKKAKKADLPGAKSGSTQLASGSHVMNDAAPIGGAWSQLAQAAPAAAPAAPAAATGQKTDTLEIVLQPNAKMELKAWMKKGEGYAFTWTASSPINFNFHGEKFNARDDEYTEYKKGIAATDKGEFKAGYDGTHGWSWRNRTKAPITVKATITGTYEKFAEKK